MESAEEMLARVIADSNALATANTRYADALNRVADTTSALSDAILEGKRLVDAATEAYLKACKERDATLFALGNLARNQFIAATTASVSRQIDN